MISQANLQSQHHPVHTQRLINNMGEQGLLTRSYVTQKSMRRMRGNSLTVTTNIGSIVHKIHIGVPEMNYPVINYIIKLHDSLFSRMTALKNTELCSIRGSTEYDVDTTTQKAWMYEWMLCSSSCSACWRWSGEHSRGTRLQVSFICILMINSRRRSSFRSLTSHSSPLHLKRQVDWLSDRAI